MVIHAKAFVKRYGPHRVFLDGVEIFQVFYIDRRRRIYKTFDVKGDHQLHMNERGDDTLRKEVKWKPRQKLELLPI